ncbi:Metalloprotease, partial [Jackrogersella minutella]
MNETAIAEQGVQPLITFLGNITENFPVTAAEYKSPKPFALGDHKTFSDTYLYLVQHSISPFLELGSFDPNSSETYIPYIVPKGVLLSSEDYEDDESRSEYENVVTQVFSSTLPTNESRSATKQLGHGLVELERKIASTVPNITSLINTTIAWDNATQLAPEFDFTSVLAAFSSSPVNRTNPLTTENNGGSAWKTPTRRWLGCLESPTWKSSTRKAIGKALEEMTVRIQHRLATNIDQAKWMTDKVKATAKHKVEAITPKLGYPRVSSNLDDAESIKDYYVELEVTGSYFDNAVSHSQWQSKTNLRSSARNDRKRHESQMRPRFSISMPPTYHKIISLPSSPAPCNDRSWTPTFPPKACNATGGTRNRSKGSTTRPSVSSSNTAATTPRSARASKRPVNGMQTLGENIADTGGFNTAYSAWLDKRHDDPASDFDLPGLSDTFTHETLFYVAAAQFFCEKADGSWKLTGLADGHSPDNVRIKSMMENSGGFRKAFNCPVKEPTCVICERGWRVVWYYGDSQVVWMIDE